MEGCASHSDPVFTRTDRIASRALRVAWRYRDCHQIERLTIHSDGGVDIRLRDPRLGWAHQQRRDRAKDRSPGTAAEEARTAPSMRQVKRRQRAADHQAAQAAAAASRSTGAQPDGVSPPGPPDGASPPVQAVGVPPPPVAAATSPSSQIMVDDVNTHSTASCDSAALTAASALGKRHERELAAAEEADRLRTERRGQKAVVLADWQ